jgi:hypothetical protein
MEDLSSGCVQFPTLLHVLQGVVEDIVGLGEEDGVTLSLGPTFGVGRPAFISESYTVLEKKVSSSVTRCFGSGETSMYYWKISHW